jgi:hypothetical protein
MVYILFDRSIALQVAEESINTDISDLDFVHLSVLIVSLYWSFPQAAFSDGLRFMYAPWIKMKLQAPTNSEDLCHVSAHVNLLVLFLKKEDHKSVF